MMMIKDWIQLLHIPEFYEIAFAMFNNIPIDDDRWAVKFHDNGKLTIQSPLGIVSNYNRLLRAHKSAENLGLMEHLSEDARKFFPSHMYMRGARRIEKGDGSVYYGFGSILFIWMVEEERISGGNRFPIFSPYGAGHDNEFPAIVEAKHIGVNFGPEGKPHHGRPKDTMKNWSRIPALKASYVLSAWYDDHMAPNRANGPSMIGFRNYREFWLEGEFKRAKWDHNGFSWPLGYMGKEATYDEVEAFVKRSKGVYPRNNQFFKEERDEFDYMTEFMIHG